MKLKIEPFYTIRAYKIWLLKSFEQFEKFIVYQNENKEEAKSQYEKLYSFVKKDTTKEQFDNFYNSL